MMPGSECGMMTLRTTSPRAGAQRVGHVDQSGRHAADDVGGHQRVEEDRADEQEGDLRRLVEPSQMISSGMNALAGRYRSNPITRLEQRPGRRGSVPMTMPSGTETSTASPNPSSTRCTVAHASANS